MFEPKYQITNKLLSQIKQINKLVFQLNQTRFPDIVLAKLEKNAREISSFASTSIEGNPLPLTEVKKILKTSPHHIRDSEKEVLNYNQALLSLNKLLSSNDHNLTTNLIQKIQEQITQDLLPQHQSGAFRQHPVIVRNPQTGHTVFLPPDYKNVNDLMQELTQFIEKNTDIIDPLLIAGIFHKQMVLIHPFIDGNGRTARLATKLLLAKLGLNIFNLFSFENYYNQNITKYFQFVGEQGNYYELANQINFTKWLEYFCEGIIDELLRVQKIMPTINLSPQTTIQPHHQKILQYIQDNNFIADRDYAKLVNRAKATRALDFQKLLKLNLITRKGKGKSTYYIITP